MKNIIATTALSLLLAQAAHAAETVTIEYPEECIQILGSDFSAPSTDSSFYLFELHCKDATGNHKVYLASWQTGGSFFGFGRALHPDEIVLVPGKENKLIVR